MPSAHTHVTPIHLISGIAAVVAVLGTLHLVALSAPDSRTARAFLALGF